jgi:hypothetical protein
MDNELMAEDYANLAFVTAKEIKEMLELEDEWLLEMLEDLPDDFKIKTYFDCGYIDGLEISNKVYFLEKKGI